MIEVKSTAVSRLNIGGWAYETVPVVEVWIDGIRFATDCKTPEAARELAARVAVTLGVVGR